MDLSALLIKIECNIFAKPYDVGAISYGFNWLKFIHIRTN